MVQLQSFTPLAHELHNERVENRVVSARIAQLNHAVKEVVRLARGRGYADDARTVYADEREDDFVEQVRINVRHLVNDDEVVGIHAPKSVNISLIHRGIAFARNIAAQQLSRERDHPEVMLHDK